jgi:SAM-dependent methyltransferase
MLLDLLIVIGILILLSAAYAAASGAPWVPTKQCDIARLKSLLALKDGERFVELGCGNGRVCRSIATHHKDVSVTGVELSILQYAFARLQSIGTHARFRFQNVFKHDLSGYNAVYMFLMPETYEKIRPKLEHELRLGSRVVSYVWAIPGWEDKLVRVDHEEGKLNLYLYQR